MGSKVGLKMSKEYLESQIREYLAKAEGLSHEFKVKMLQNLIEKIIIVSSGSLLLSKTDLGQIVGRAKQIHSSISLPIKVSNSELDYSEVNHLCMVLSVLDWLTVRDALKKQIELEKK